MKQYYIKKNELGEVSHIFSYDDEVATLAEAIEPGYINITNELLMTNEEVDAMLITVAQDSKLHYRNGILFLKDLYTFQP